MKVILILLLMIGLLTYFFIIKSDITVDKILSPFPPTLVTQPPYDKKTEGEFIEQQSTKSAIVKPTIRRTY